MRGVIQSTFTDELRTADTQFIQQQTQQYQSIAPKKFIEDGADCSVEDVDVNRDGDFGQGENPEENPNTDNMME